MSKTDDQLISQFMQANKHDIADNGFSRRVMHRLPTPHRAKVYSDILTLVGAVIGCILFIAADGINVILGVLYRFFQHQALSIASSNINLPALLFALAVLTYFGVQRACNVKE